MERVGGFECNPRVQQRDEPHKSDLPLRAFLVGMAKRQKGATMIHQVTIFVPGVPQPGGSKTANKGGGVHDANKKTKPWQACVSAAANDAWKKEPLRGEIVLEMIFYRPRPTGQYGTGRNIGILKDSAPPMPIVTPDLTKMLRSTEDALVGIVIGDDCQVVHTEQWKVYCTDHPEGKVGALITVGLWEQSDHEELMRLVASRFEDAKECKRNAQRNP